MKITTSEIQHIANLARLNLEKGEVELYQAQLSAILDHIQKLQNVPAEATNEESDPVENIQSMRQDDSKPGLQYPELLKNSKNTEKKQFKIPPVFE